MVKLVMLIGGGLVWTGLISAVFGHAPWNRTFGPSDGGKEQIWEHRNRNFSQYRPGAGSYQKDQHNYHHHGPWSWNEYRPHHRPSPFNLEENTTVVWPNLDQGPDTTTSKFVPLINMRPALGSSSIFQSSPVLNLASEQATTTTRRPNLTQEVSLQAGNATSGSTAGSTTTTPKPSIQHNSDDDYDWSAFGLEDEEAVQNQMSGTKSIIDRLRCRKCRQRFQKNFG